MTQQEAERLFGLAADARLTGGDAPTWVERLTPEKEQLVQAARFLSENGQEEAAAELGANVWRLWLITGDPAGGRRLLEVALEVGEGKPSRARALALYGDGALAFRTGAMTESRERNEAALEVARAVGDAEAESLALVGLSRVAFRDGDYARVRSLATEARELTSGLDDAAGVPALHLLAAGTRLAGAYDEAAAIYHESLELNRRLGDSRMVGMELHNLGHVEVHRGNVDAAERCFAERAELAPQNDPYEAAMTDLNKAALAFVRGDRRRASELLDRTQSTLDGVGIVLDPDDAFEVDWLRQELSGG
jgi:tetratricopeptide (TPR) repeat protein